MNALAKAAVAVILVLAFGWASASSLGVIVGAPSGGASAEGSGVRERVRLVRSGRLLVGRPTQSVVQLVVIDAPDAGADHLLMREIRMPDGRHSVLFTAPSGFANRVRRTSLYVREDGRNWTVLESVDGRTLSHDAHPVAVARGNAGAADDDVLNPLLAFAVSGLGPFWLVDEGTVVSAPDAAQTARSLLGLEAVRALSYIGGTVLLLMLGRMVSLWAHRRDRHGC